MTTATRGYEAGDNRVMDYRDIMAEWDVPGLAIGTITPDALQVYTAGVASLSTEAPITDDTVFGIGSISKVFTATLAMCLVDTGQLDLDTPISQYYPDLTLADERANAELSMRHLLTHTGGFASDGFKDFGNGDDALRSYTLGFGQLEQVSAAGELWSYSNDGFGLAGAVLAHLCGTTFERAIQEYILVPLGLRRTGFGQEPVAVNTAFGYEFGPDGEPEEQHPGGITRSANPAGGMLSNVGDLLRFARFHLGSQPGEFPKILSNASRRQMQQTQVAVSSIEAWGIGWGKCLEGDQWLIEHRGWYNGFRSQLTLLPEHQSALVILTNGPRGHAAIQDIQKDLLARQFGIEEAPFSPYELSSITARTYAARYVQSQMDVEIIEGKDGLTMLLKTQWHGEENDEPLRFPLLAADEHELIMQGGEFDGSRVVFILNSDQSVRFVRVLNRLCSPVE